MSKPAYAISAETLTHSFVCLDDLVLPGRNCPEIIRDSIPELFPILRQGCFKELCDCFREFFIGVIMSIMGNPLVHETPKRLNGIEMRRVWRQEVEFYTTSRSIKPWLKQLGMMIARIVEDDVNKIRQRIGYFDLFQQLKGGFGIDPFTLNGDELETIEIKCTLKVEPLATRSGFNRRLLVLWEPTMGWTALILGMHSIRKQNFVFRKQ